MAIRSFCLNEINYINNTLSLTFFILFTKKHCLQLFFREAYLLNFFRIRLPALKGIPLNLNILEFLNLSDNLLNFGSGKVRKACLEFREFGIKHINSSSTIMLQIFEHHSVHIRTLEVFPLLLLLFRSRLLRNTLLDSLFLLWGKFIALLNLFQLTHFLNLQLHSFAHALKKILRVSFHSLLRRLILHVIYLVKELFVFFLHVSSYELCLLFLHGFL